MDHFAGFDRLLRVCLHRPAPLHLVGPTGFADHVEHKLKAYTLNLLDAQSVDFAIVASEFNGSGFDRVCEFRAREARRRCRRERPDREGQAGRHVARETGPAQHGQPRTPE
jgi:ribonuclease Z